MDIQSIIFDDREKWLKFREGYISSTECAPMFNEGKWASFYKLWHTKNGTLEDDFKDSKFTKSGRRYEICTSEHFAEDYNCTFKDIPEYRFCNEYRIGSTYDFMVTSGQYEGYILETKRLTSWGARTWEDGKPPYQYELQCQHQLALYPEAKGVILCCLFDGWELEIFPMNRNERIIDLIKVKSLEFWDSIEKCLEPEIDWNDQDSAQKVHSKEDGTEIIADEAMAYNAESFDNLGKKIKQLENERSKFKTMLLASTKASKALLPDGRTLDLVFQEGSEGKPITQEMVGQIFGARKGFRRCQIRGKVK